MYLSENELKAIENDDCTVLSYDSWLVREMKRTNYGLKDCFACKYPVGDCTCF